jgi:hypothetical protein
MTTKQGKLYLKRKNKPIIEGMTSDPLADVPGNEFDLVAIRNKNNDNANAGLTKCNKVCDDEASNKEICKIGCDIKHKSKNNGQDEYTNAIFHANKYEKYRKTPYYDDPITKNNREVITHGYSYMSPPDKVVKEISHYKTVKKYYTKYRTKRICIPAAFWWSSGWCYSWSVPYTVVKSKQVPQYRWRKIPGTKHVVPTKYRHTRWKETTEYSEDDARDNLKILTDISGKNYADGTKAGQFKGCNDINITEKQVDEDEDYIRNYNSYGKQDKKDCELGINSYSRENCNYTNIDNKNNDNNENHVYNFSGCNTVKYGSIHQDEENLDVYNEEWNQYVVSDSSTSGFQNYKESFTDRCSDDCQDYINGVKTIPINAVKNEKDRIDFQDCYDCEIKNNPLIKHTKLQTEFVDNILWKAVPNVDTIKMKLNSLSDENKNLESNLTLENIENDKEFRYKKIKNYNKILIDNYENPTNHLRKMIKKKKERNLTINAFLEDMKKKTPSKNIEYTVMIGLLVAAGVSTAMLLKD